MLVTVGRGMVCAPQSPVGSGILVAPHLDKVPRVPQPQHVVARAGQLRMHVQLGAPVVPEPAFDASALTLTAGVRVVARLSQCPIAQKA